MGVSIEDLADAAQLASLADETPEGRSIVVLAKQQYNLRGRDIEKLGAKFIPFSAQTRMSGVDLDSRQIRKGAVDAIEKFVKSHGGVIPDKIRQMSQKIAKERRHAFGCGGWGKGAWGNSSQRHCQRRHQGTIRRFAQDGHQDGDDYRR